MPTPTYGKRESTGRPRLRSTNLLTTQLDTKLERVVDKHGGCPVE